MQLNIKQIDIHLNYTILSLIWFSTNKYKPVHLDQCSQPTLEPIDVVNIDLVSCWQLAEAALVE